MMFLMGYISGLSLVCLLTQIKVKLVKHMGITLINRLYLSLGVYSFRQILVFLSQKTTLLF